MCDEEVTEPEVSKLIISGIMLCGTAVNLLSRRIRTREIVPRQGKMVLIMRGFPLNKGATSRRRVSREMLSGYCSSCLRKEQRCWRTLHPLMTIVLSLDDDPLQ